MNATKFQSYLDDARRDPDVYGSLETLEFYVARREEGMSHNFAAMLACQRFPGTKTEVMYFEGRHTLANQFKGNEQQLEAVVAAAKARGYTPGTYDIYEPDLADDIGDPKAFIKPCGGLTQVRQTCEENDLSCNGLYKRKRSTIGQSADDKPVALAPDIVDSLVASKIVAEPGLAEKIKKDPRKLQEAREAVVAEHGYSDAKKSGGFSSPFTQTPAEAKQTRRPLTDKARARGKSKPKRISR